MTVIVEYGLGGYRANHPSQGRVYEANDDTETVTRWNDVGTVIDTRPYSAAEKADKAARVLAATRQDNGRTVEQRARTALTGNATYLAIASPTNAQNLAQIRALTRQASALIRLTLNELDNIDDTGTTSR